VSDALQAARARLFLALGWSPPPALVDEALTHRSYANEKGGMKSTIRDNQRLEFLGDAVLGLCVSELLMQSFPDADEGELSRIRSGLVKAEPLAEFGRNVGLGEALRLGRGAIASGDQRQKNVLADAVEALVGAAYLDGGHEAARALVARVVAENLQRINELRSLDPKSELQELVQERGGKSPTYRLAGTEGSEGDRSFLIEVLVGDEVRGAGRARSKKLAEQQAAQAALVWLRANPPAPAAPPAPPPARPR
jgi:ribonuclease-3